jgi:hypothetical protein
MKKKDLLKQLEGIRKRSEETQRMLRERIEFHERRRAKLREASEERPS